jgi:hypothetical protein
MKILFWSFYGASPYLGPIAVLSIFRVFVIELILNIVIIGSKS